MSETEDHERSGENENEKETAIGKQQFLFTISAVEVPAIASNLRNLSVSLL
jgi:hypothetical protein